MRISDWSSDVCSSDLAIALNVRISMRQRSSYPKPFKAQVVQECLQPGATLSSVAISHGINANVIRKWLPLYRDQSPAALPAFIPLRATPKRDRKSTRLNSSH